MRQKRRKFSSAFKAQVAIEAIKERESLTELAKRFEIHPNLIKRWKQEFLEGSSSVFDKKTKEKDTSDEMEELYSKIGKLEMYNDFLKKNLKKMGL